MVILGVGKVTEKAVHVKDFEIEYNVEKISILEAPTKSNGLDYKIDDLDDHFYLSRLIGLRLLMLKMLIGKRVKS